MLIGNWVKTKENEYYRLADVHQFRASKWGVQLFLKGNDYAVDVWWPEGMEDDGVSDEAIEKRCVEYLDDMLAKTGWGDLWNP